MSCVGFVILQRLQEEQSAPHVATTFRRVLVIGRTSAQPYRGRTYIFSMNTNLAFEGSLVSKYEVDCSRITMNLSCTPVLTRFTQIWANNIGCQAAEQRGILQIFSVVIAIWGRWDEGVPHRNRGLRGIHVVKRDDKKGPVDVGVCPVLFQLHNTVPMHRQSSNLHPGNDLRRTYVSISSVPQLHALHRSMRRDTFSAESSSWHHLV